MIRRLRAAGFLVLAAITVPAQTTPPPVDKLEFEAASVKLVTFPKDGRFRVGSRFEPGQFIAEYISMRDCIGAAYPVSAGARIQGPDWMDSDSVRYNITAKASGPASPQDLRIMLQHLLASRFHLKLHTEDRPAPIYALVVNGKGTRLSSVKFDGDDPNKGAIHYVASGAEFQHASMKLLAGFLGIVGRPVIDATGIQDLFDFKLTYANRGGRPVLDAPATGASASGEGAGGDTDQPSIFAALQGLGLKLENRQGHVTDYIIDHVDRVPVED